MNKIISIAKLSRGIGWCIVIYAFLNIPIFIKSNYYTFTNAPLSFQQTLPFIFGGVQSIVYLFTIGLLFLGGAQLIVLVFQMRVKNIHDRKIKDYHINKQEL